MLQNQPSNELTWRNHSSPEGRKVWGGFGDGPGKGKDTWFPLRADGLPGREAGGSKLEAGGLNPRQDLAGTREGKEDVGRVRAEALAHADVSTAPSRAAVLTPRLVRTSLLETLTHQK